MTNISLAFGISILISPVMMIIGMTSDALTLQFAITLFFAVCKYGKDQVQRWGEGIGTGNRKGFPPPQLLCKTSNIKIKTIFQSPRINNHQNNEPSWHFFPFSLMLIKSDHLFQKTPTSVEYSHQETPHTKDSTFEPVSCEPRLRG